MPWTSTDTGPFPAPGAGDITQPVPVAETGGGRRPEVTGPVPATGPFGPPAAVTASVVGATLDDLELSALWRSGRHLLAVDQSVPRRLVWLGMVTITFAGAMVGAVAVGPALPGAVASALITIGIGLILADLVGVFVLAAQADRRPTSRVYMERHMAARRLAAPCDEPGSRSGS